MTLLNDELASSKSLEQKIFWRRDLDFVRVSEIQCESYSQKLSDPDRERNICGSDNLIKV